MLFDDEAPDPAARSRRVWWVLGAAALVAVVAIGALLVTRSMRTQSYPVPALAGLTIGEAQNQIAGNGWEVTVTTEQSDVQPADHVIRTDPDVGVEVKEGDPFTVVVSSGPPPTPLPDLTGQTVDAAAALVTQAGLVPDVQAAEYDEGVPQGAVLRWTVPAQPQLVAGDMVQKGTSVQIVPSNGPAPRVMPDMVNVPLDRSVAALDERQLTYTVVEQFVTDDVAQPAGNVIAQSIPPKTEVPRGTSVELTVSKGRDLIPFPDLTGLDAAGVQATLTANGFTVGVVAGDTTQPLQQVLIDGQPATTGGMYARGATVNLVYPEPPAATAPPG